jgi:hypothetical protein
MANTLRVRYFGTNVGKIYFTDIDKRNQLGGAQEGNYIGGQDEYIMWGETKVLQLTDNVLYSMTKGVLKYFSTDASSAIFTAHNGAPLLLTEGAYTSADEVPRQDIGDTGTSRFINTYMDKLANDKYSTGLAGSTGYYYGNA